MRGWEERKQRKEDTLYNKQSRALAVFKLVKSSAPYPNSGLVIEPFHQQSSFILRNGHFPNHRRMPPKVFKTQQRRQGLLFCLPPKEISIFPANNRLYSLPERQQPWVTRMATSQCQRAAVTSPCRALILTPIPPPTEKLPFSVMPMCACQLSASWHKDTAG